MPSPNPDAVLILRRNSLVWAVWHMSEPSNVRTTVLNLSADAHVCVVLAFHGVTAYGCCVVQASSMAMGPEELLAMTRDCGLNRLVQYAPFVSKHIRAAQQDAEVKRVLQSMRQILHTGVALNPEDEKWGLENRLVLTVRLSFSSARRGVSHRLDGQSMYGTSETGTRIHLN